MGGDRPRRARSRSSAAASAPSAWPATTTRWSCVDGPRAGQPARRTRCAWTASGCGRRPDRRTRRSRIRTLGRRPAGAARVRFLPLRDPDRRRRRRARSTPTRWTRYAAADGHGARGRWPDALLLLGDQVYADETSPSARRSGSGRAATSPTPPGDAGARTSRSTPGSTQESWTDPQVRWLLSTRARASMIFDDHDMRDDWNTSDAWRAGDAGAPAWWQERIIGGLSSYWVYQHLGNLSPARRSPRTSSTSGCGRTTATPSRCCASSPPPPTRRPTGTRARGGPTGATSATPAARDRLALRPDARRRATADGRPTTSSPGSRQQVERRLRPPARRHVAAVAAAPRAARPRVLERARSPTGRAGRGWPAGREDAAGRRPGALGGVPASPSTGSAELFARSAAASRGPAAGRRRRSACCPATSTTPTPPRRTSASDGDVEPVYQLTCSPLHNYVPRLMKVTFRVSLEPADRAGRCGSCSAGCPSVPPRRWSGNASAGRYYGDQIATLHLDGRSARVRFEQAGADPQEDGNLTTVSDLPLS